jgi:hypothetical protein
MFFGFGPGESMEKQVKAGGNFNWMMGESALNFHLHQVDSLLGRN